MLGVVPVMTPFCILSLFDELDDRRHYCSVHSSSEDEILMYTILLRYQLTVGDQKLTTSTIMMHSGTIDVGTIDHKTIDPLL